MKLAPQPIKLQKLNDIKLQKKKKEDRKML